MKKRDTSAQKSGQDREDYYSVIRALWSRTDKDRSRFPASHTSICHFTMQRIHTHTPFHRNGKKETLAQRKTERKEAGERWTQGPCVNIRVTD